MLTDIQIKKIMDSLTLDDKIGQMFCYWLDPRLDTEEVERRVKDTLPGSFFVAGVTREEIKDCTKHMEKYTKLPPMIAADVEKGPGHVVYGETDLPFQMAWGACNDEELIEKAHIATAERCRELGIHWTFSPIVDINYNKDNPVVNIRAISDVPECVARIGTAAVRGYQKNGMMVAGCKHFPGDGVDDRNQHFCTTINRLDEKTWMETFGYVYKEMFKVGAASVMVAHISLPAFDEKINDRLGYPPASLSYNLQTKLLKEKLGFSGCIVSDALSMVGACAVVEPERLPIEFIKAGGDVLLFPLPEWHGYIKEAVESGEISMQRIDDAVSRIIRLKDKARLFEDQNLVLNDMEHLYDLQKLADEIAEKSLCKIRDEDAVLPLKLNPDDKILILNLRKDKNPKTEAYERDLTIVEKELQKRGYRTVTYVNPSRKEFEKDFVDAAAVLINFDSRRYFGGSLRITWDHVAPFWRAEVLKHPKVIFTSFGCPYKLYDFPYLKCYVNTFSTMECSQRAFVRAILGEIEFQGKNPVSLPDFFESEVEK